MHSVTLGEISRIGHCTFGFCGKFENFTVPESVQQICSKAFKCCDNLVVKVPESLRKSGEIGENAFYKCKEVIYI